MRTHKASTTLSDTEAYRLDGMCRKLGVTRSEFIRQVVLIAIGAPELRATIKEAMRAHLRSDSDV